MPRHALLPTLALMTAISGAAAAQTTPSPEQARAVEAQITAWLKQVTANAVPLPARPVELTPEGDHYLARVPLGDFGHMKPPGAALTAKARQLDATRWAIDDQQIPPDLTFTTTEMVPDVPDAKDPHPSGLHGETVTYHLVLGKQDSHAIFDPTYSTPTTSSGSVASLDLTKTGGMSPSTTHIGLFTSQSTSQPIDPAHVNLQGEATGADYSLKADMPDGTGFSLTADRLHVMSSISGLAHDQIVPMIQTVATLGELAKTAKPDEAADGLSPAEKAALRKLLTQAHAILTGAKVDESLEGVKFDFSGTEGAVGKIGLTFSGDAPQDTLTADLGFTMDGLEVDGLPPNLEGYLPTHFTIHHTVSNINLAALTKIGEDMTAPTPPGQAPAEPDVAALFGKGGLDVGFDGLALDIPGTTLTGSGKFVATGPQTVTGQAEFTARGLDGLIGKMQADPMLAQGVPVVIFLKGIAHTTADQSVWQISVNNTKVLVNGVDLSAMAGAMNK